MERREICGVSCLLASFLFSAVPVPGQTSTNSWTKPSSGNWDDPSAWSLGTLPNSSQSVLITNSGWKAVAINPSTPINFSNAMTVDSLTIRGAWDTMNALLLNYAGTTTPLHVLKNFNIETNGRLVMLYSGLRVDNLLHLRGELDQEGGQLIFTNALMQIEGARFNLTNGVVNGSSMYLGGTSDGYMNHDSAVVSLNWLALGGKAGNLVPGGVSNGTYVLRNGWLIVGAIEQIGHHGLGTLIQDGGTNTASFIQVGKGHYLKNGGGLFAGGLNIVSPSEFPSPNMTHAGGTATISNALRLVGGWRLGPTPVGFHMLGGLLSTPRIELEYAGIFTHSNGTVNVANELLISSETYSGTSYYSLSGGNLFAGRTTISYSCSVNQSGGTHIVTNKLGMAGSDAIYRFSGGTLNSRNIVLEGNFPYGPKFFILGAPPFAIANENFSLLGAAIDIRDSAQQFGRLTIERESVLNFGGNSAILRFADSHTNTWETGYDWESGLYARLVVSNWNGSLNGGGTDQLRFGNNQSALTPAQVRRIHFVNPAGMPAGTYPGRILATGEVVPGSRPALSMTRSPTKMVFSWSGNYQLCSSTNVLGPYTAIEGATSPYAVFFSRPQRFFYLRSP